MRTIRMPTSRSRTTWCGSSKPPGTEHGFRSFSCDVMSVKTVLCPRWLKRRETGKKAGWSFERINPQIDTFKLNNYFQPASFSQAFISSGWVFSQLEMDFISLSSIFPFMHLQYLLTTVAVAPSLALSLTHFAIHLSSSAPENAWLLTISAAIGTHLKIDFFTVRSLIVDIVTTVYITFVTQARQKRAKKF